MQTVRVDVADPPEGRDTLVLLRVETGPGGDTVEDNVTVPANPLMLVRVMGVVAQKFGGTVRLVRPAVMA